MREEKSTEACEVSTFRVTDGNRDPLSMLYTGWRVRLCEQKRADRARFSTHRISHPGPHEVA